MKRFLFILFLLVCAAFPAGASQYDFGTIDTSTTTGDDLATLLQNWRSALNTVHSGSSRPSYAASGTVWLDTTSSSLWLMKQYDGSSDVIIGSVNTSTHKYTPYFNGAAVGAVVSEAIGQGLEDDGSGNLRVKLDGATLARSSSGMKVATGGVGATELASTAVTAGSYINASITVDADGRLTAASNGGSNVLRSYLSGLGISNNTGTPNTKVDIAAGVAADDTNTVMIGNASTLTVNFGATGANGLDTGAIAANKWYHVWDIAKADGTVAGFADRADLAGLSPTLPSGYSYKRRLGSVLTDGSSHIIAFVQNGDWFYLKSPLLDQNATTVNATATTITLSVPTGVKVIPLFTSTNSAQTSRGVYFSSMDQNDDAPGTTAAPLVDMLVNSSFAQSSPGPLIWTNTSAQIRARAATAAPTSFYLSTRGWMDSRGRDN